MNDCAGVLNETSAEKAAYKDNGPAAEQPESWPFVSGNKALQVLSNQHSFHRYTRGVHDECCLKACSFSELTLYCSEPVIKPPSSNHFF